MRNTLLILAGAIGAAMSSLGAGAGTQGAHRRRLQVQRASRSAPNTRRPAETSSSSTTTPSARLVKRVEAGETFDVIFLTPEAIDELAAKGKIAPFSRTNLARVGVGVMVKEGAPKPDVSTVDAFKKALLDAKSVSYIDPASGGSSGIYVGKLLQRLGIADQVKPKEKLKHGGYVADLDLIRPVGARHPSDQRDRARQRRHLGRAVAQGDPELHRLCRGRSVPTPNIPMRRRS